MGIKTECKANLQRILELQLTHAVGIKTSHILRYSIIIALQLTHAVGIKTAVCVDFFYSAVLQLTHAVGIKTHFLPQDRIPHDHYNSRTSWVLKPKKAG